MRLFYLSLFTLLQLTLLIEANEHLLFEAVKPTITLTQDDGQPTHVSSRKDTHDDQHVKTQVDVVYTTIIVAATPSLPVFYNISGTNPAQQQQQQQQQQASQTAASDPNRQNSVKEDLEKDKQALKRMSTILSLVGGLGVIAIVATIVIFTRMRRRHRKQRESDEEGNEGSTYELSGEADRATITDSSIPGGSSGDGGARSIASSSTHSLVDTPLMEPSAPPALSIAEDRHSLISKQAQQQNRRTVMSISSQATAPSPSAPTAKELDGMEDEGLGHSHDHATTSAATNCSRCTVTPELPPPAYTPSAPPHYALPVEPTIMESRRHSLGG
ncbi:uncharacterized protein EV154DRAFT_514631 [Mucor mucedo]|uniref:uncharacterized protein n=1 Tax=Mucor mucedo TaxID=29922 RepID=UPI00221FA8E3|nr:uncharacterized protein EV154DRAFT_514631 [Mucor mucedo]KAI7889422.1 hypothetical protein EV154DRAFT_514631 [Mucor mucedo]